MHIQLPVGLIILFRKSLGYFYIYYTYYLKGQRMFNATVQLLSQKRHTTNEVDQIY